jgi:hypothetical protein
MNLLRLREVDFKMIENREDSEHEESDWEFLKRLNADMRENRRQRFIKEYLEKFRAKYEVRSEEHKFSIHTQEFGIVDYWAKANKVLERKKNIWHKPGLKWLLKNLLNEQE